MNEKEFFKAAFDNNYFCEDRFKHNIPFINTLFEMNFKIKSKKADFPADARILNIYILLPHRDLCKRFYFLDYFFCKNKEDFINAFLSEKDRYPSYIIYLFESDGKHFFADGELNIINKVSDEVLQSDKYDADWFFYISDEEQNPCEGCPIWYCNIFDNEKYAVLQSSDQFILFNIDVATSDLMKQILKMTSDYAEFRGIAELSTAFKFIHYQYDKLFFAKTEDEILNTRITDLVNLPYHNTYHLFHYGAKTIGEMLKLTDDEIPRIPDFRKTNVEEVKQMQKDVAEILDFARQNKHLPNE